MNSSDEEEQAECVEVLLNLELEEDIVYMLINSNIYNENAIKLLNLIRIDYIFYVALSV